jgi:hypothetical protein
MPKLTSPLDRLRIAAPCSADWDQMFSFEDRRVRFCSQCNLNVYNLSGMSRHEAEALITKTEGRLCVRFYRRADGSILTQNCPVGLKAVKRRVSWVAQAVLGMVLSFVWGLGLYIFYVGKRPFPILDTRSIFENRVVVMGGISPVPEFQGQAMAPEIGKSRVEPRQSNRVPHSKAKGRSQDQSINKDE